MARGSRLVKFKNTALRMTALLLLGGITFVFARGAVRMYDRYDEASTAKAAAVAELQLLREREGELAGDTKHLTSDRGVEEELRKRFGVVREGEGVIEITEAPPPPPKDDEQGALRKWLNWLF